MSEGCELKISSMLKQHKYISGLIKSHMKHLITNLNCPESLEQLLFIISEFYLAFSSNISLDPVKMYTFLHSIDIEIFEICDYLVQKGLTDIQRTPEDYATNTTECLKNILTESNMQLFEIEKVTTGLERLKIVSLAFICQMSVQFIQLGISQNIIYT